MSTMMLAAALAILREDADAIGSARAAVAEAQRKFGPDHPATAMFLRNLALAYAQAGYYKRAEPTARHALSLLEDAFGAGDVSLVPVLNVLAETYAAERRYVEARRMAQRAVAIGPEAGLHYATALQNLAAVFECENNLKMAAEYYARALGVREALLPRGHAHIEAAREALARVQRAGPRKTTRQALVASQ